MERKIAWSISSSWKSLISTDFPGSRALPEKIFQKLPFYLKMKTSTIKKSFLFVLVIAVVIASAWFLAWFVFERGLLPHS